MTSKKRILLLRSNEDRPDPYKAQLQSDKYEVIQVPVLQFQYIHQENLIQKLKNPEKYNSIVFTSVRSVEAVAKVMSDDPRKNCLLESWHSKKCYVVGESTYSKVLDTLRWKSRWDSSQILSGFFWNNYFLY